MEKVLKKMPGAMDGIHADVVLEINASHPIAKKLKELFANDKEKVASYAKILYAEARLIGGLSVENPAELTELISSLMV